MTSMGNGVNSITACILMRHCLKMKIKEGMRMELSDRTLSMPKALDPISSISQRKEERMERGIRGKGKVRKICLRKT